MKIRVVIHIGKAEIEIDNMTDTSDNRVSFCTHIGAGLPPATRMGRGSISSTVTGVAGSRDGAYLSVAGADTVRGVKQDKLTQA